MSHFSELVDLYGYVPSFHDAHVLSIEFGRDWMQMGVYLYDKPQEGKWKQEWDFDLHCFLTLRWDNLRQAEVPLSSPWLDEMAFDWGCARVTTTFTDQNSGRKGIINAATVTLVSIVPATKQFLRLNGDPIDFTLVTANPEI